jgi:hypothetical protein
MDRLAEIRELAEWEPAMGVLSVRLGFAPGDRGRGWRTRLRNGIESVLAAAEGAAHQRRMAVRATAARLAERYRDEELRPPPRGEIGYLEVSGGAGLERWYPIAVEPLTDGATVIAATRPLLAPLVDARRRQQPHGVVLVSAERVRLLRFDPDGLDELADWELSVTSLDWRERKSRISSDPAAAQGVSSSGHDRYRDRLRHNRERFLAEAGGLVARRLLERGIGDVVVFGPAPDREAFESGADRGAVRVRAGSSADLIAVPTGLLDGDVGATVESLATEEDRALVERALGRAGGGQPGAVGPDETAAALAEGRVENLVIDPTVAEAEGLVRGALMTDAEITTIRGECAELLAVAGGVAALLRY